jgi:hypothetical protein
MPELWRKSSLISPRKLYPLGTFQPFLTLSQKITKLHSLFGASSLEFFVENRPFKVKSGKGVGNWPSEESAKVTPEYLKGSPRSQEEIKWATRAMSILLERG